MTVFSHFEGAVAAGEKHTSAAKSARAITFSPPRYARYAARRFAQAALLLFLVIVTTFALITLAPGDMVDVIAGEAGAGDPAYLDSLRARYGLDQPLLSRLGAYLYQIGQLDLGFSFRRNQPVLDAILERVGPTALLMVSSIVLAAFGAIVLSLTAARFAHKWPDRVISVVALLAYATPMFWVGLMLILVFAAQWQILPSGGMETLFSGKTGLERALDIARHMVLPTLTLALVQLALYTRLLRASLLEVLKQDYVRTARAKGLSRFDVLRKHALGNALLPLVTMVGMQLGSILGGSVVIESVFAWPGLGRLTFDALMERDTNLIVGIVLFSSAFVIAVNFLVDLLYGWLDPRIRLG